MGIGDGTASGAEQAFKTRLGDMGSPRILELGTRRWEADRPTHHKAWRPEASWTFSDFLDGIDVDVVADAHDLAPFADGCFDAFVAVSVWEHLRRPWIAARAAARVLRTGGIAFVCTHQTFPLHGYPDDYFRFSAEALAGIFDDAGFATMEAGYQYPSQIVPPPEVTRWNKAAPNFLNVAWSGWKR
jgi:SAM-dependent methyltransferase